MDLICDTLRAASMNYDDPHQVEEVLDKRMEATLHHALHSSHALQTVADGLPALGIVAAVLGVIKTMGSIDQPPEVLGKMIGGALVGTFLGVFLAYGLIGPFAARVKAVVEEDIAFLPADPRGAGRQPAPPPRQHLHRGRPPEHAASRAPQLRRSGRGDAQPEAGGGMIRSVAFLMVVFADLPLPKPLGSIRANTTILPALWSSSQARPNGRSAVRPKAMRFAILQTAQPEYDHLRRLAKDLAHAGFGIAA